MIHMTPTSNTGVVPPWLRDPIKYLPIEPMAYIPEPDHPPRYWQASRGAMLVRATEEL